MMTSLLLAKLTWLIIFLNTLS